MHSSRKQLLLRNRFAKPLIDDLIKLLLLAAAMKYSSCLTGRLADVLLSLHSSFYFLQNVFVFGLLLLFAGINESQLGVKRRHRVALGSAQSPLAAWDVEHSWKPSSLHNSLHLFYSRVCTSLFFPSRNVGHIYLFIYFPVAFSRRRRQRGNASSSEQNQTSPCENSSFHSFSSKFGGQQPHFVC